MSFLSQQDAQKVDELLMSKQGGFSIDQLMELAGLAVAEAVLDAYPDSKHILICCGPGNNGGDGLVAARHLYHFGQCPILFYPKQTDKPLYQNLVKQLQNLDIPFVDTIEQGLEKANLVLDALFGFSFHGPIRPPFDAILQTLIQCCIPIVSVDIPSGWHVELGDQQGNGLKPDMVISLTAPKLCMKEYQGRHYVGGRFVPPSLAKTFHLTLPCYPSSRQCVCISS